MAREAAQYLWNLKEVLEEGTIEERRKFVEFFVEGVRINGAEGRVETTFYESPALPKAAVPFCFMPPRGSTPYGRKPAAQAYEVIDFPQPPKSRRTPLPAGLPKASS